MQQPLMAADKQVVVLVLHVVQLGSMAVVQQLMQKEDDQEFTWHWHSIKDDNDDEGDVDPKPDAVQITDKWRWGDTWQFSLQVGGFSGDNKSRLPQLIGEGNGGQWVFIKFKY